MGSAATIRAAACEARLKVPIRFTAMVFEKSVGVMRLPPRHGLGRRRDAGAGHRNADRAHLVGHLRKPSATEAASVTSTV
jgi:hypothetical protein